MAFNISYKFKALDGFTATAKKIDRSVVRTQRKFRKLSKQMKKATKDANRLNGAMGGLKSKVLAVGAALTAAVGVKALVDFGSAMSKVEAVSGATGVQLKAMRMQAKQLGATTVFSASEAAGGMEFLARAGFEASTIIGAMPSVLDLAASSSLDLATAADITSNIMTGFNIKASETNKIADIMATINASANTNVQQLGDAMKFVGPIASAMGQSIEVTAAAMGALSDAGLQGSMAGTGLRRVLSELATPTKAVKKGLQSLGVDLSKINPETNDLVTVLKELEKAELSAGQALKIFGDRGGPAFSVMIRNIPKIEKLRTKLNKSAGAAKRMAEIMRNNLLGAGKETISAFEGLIITIGDLGLTGALRGVAGSITFVVRNINSLMEKFPLLTKGIAFAVGVLITAKIAALAYAAAIRIAAISTAALSIPLIAVIGLLTAAIILYKKFEKVRENLKKSKEVRQRIEADIQKQREADAVFLFERKLKKEFGDLSKFGPESVSAKAQNNTTTLNGSIDINAPKGVVAAASSTVKGASGNLGINMAGAGL